MEAKAIWLEKDRIGCRERYEYDTKTKLSNR